MASSQMRISGINSGLDTEAMIQQMMSAYQSKINQQNQKLQKLQWQQEIYRDIISKMTTFKNKYFDILKRDTYLLSPTSFSKFKATMTSKSGKDTGLKVTTSSKSVEGTHRIKVDQLATAATTKGGQVASANFKLDVDKAMANSGVEPDEEGNYNYSFALDVKVGNVAKTVEFSGTNKDELLQSLNDNLKEAFGTTSSGEAFISAEENENGEFAFKTAGNAIATVTERKGDFGMTKLSKSVGVDFTQALTGKSSVSVTVPNYYTGKAVTKNVEFMTVSTTYFDARTENAEIDAVFQNLKKSACAKAYGVTEGRVTDEMMANFNFTSADAAYTVNQQNMMGALNSAFGFEQGVYFSYDSAGNITAKYATIDGSAAEFSITSTCDATFGIQKGSATSYIDENTKLSDMGIEMNVFSINTRTVTRPVLGEDGQPTYDEDGNEITEEVEEEYEEGVGYSLNINGKDIVLGENATIADLIETVNKSGAGVTMSYSKMEGGFTIVANDKGSGGNINIQEDNVVAKALGLTSDTRKSYTEGQNAIVTIDGVTIEHNDNVYELDGTTYDFSEVDPTSGEEITVGISKDYDDIKQAIKDFVNDYNAMIDEITGYTKTARPRDSSSNSYYEPLTDEEKEEMSEKEIELWEEKAKTGLLYNDSTVNTVLSKLRSALYGTVTLEDGSKFGLFNMGIKVTSFLEDMDASKLGKLTLDEDAFDKAFAANADAITKFFTDPNEGVMAQVNKTLENAVKDSVTSKGTLVRKAGLATGTSVKDNTIYREMERITKRIETLQTRYNKKEEYWWKVFTNLEKMQAQFASQQSYLEQFTASGGYFSS